MAWCLFVMNAWSATSPPAAIPTPQPHAWWMARHLEKLSQGPRDPVSLLFIGDSITQGWEEAGQAVWDQYYADRGAVNLGFNGDQTEHVLWRIAHGEVDGLAPDVTILLIGTNNRATRQETALESVAGIEAIVQRLRSVLPHTTILLLALFPRGSSQDDSLRRHHAEVNAHLSTLADQTSIFFLDLGALFVDKDGRLQQALMPDGLHTSEEGYRVWAEGMEATIQELLRAARPR